MGKYILSILAAGVLVAGAAARGAENGMRAVRLPGPMTGTTLAAPGQMVDVQADRLSYDSARKLILARGNVKVTRGAEWVTCDEADVDTVGQVVAARGNIELHYGDGIWRGEEVTYNFKTGEGDFGEFDLYVPPWHVVAEKSKRVSESMVELEGVMLTSCDPDAPEYSVRTPKANLVSNRVVQARNVRFQLGVVPFFWVPYAKGDVRNFANFDVVPGYRSKLGAFLMTTYNYPLDDVWTTHTHLDLRSERGVGVGEDLEWEDRETGAYKGMLRLYYADDQKLWRNESQRQVREGEIENDRYWVRLTDRHNLTDRDYFIGSLHYLSDKWLLNDFFDDEYQKNVQPENRVTLMHRGDSYTAGLELNARLNDFYSNVNRLPEAFLDFNRQQVFGTPFYYEGENTASYLEKVFRKSTNSVSDYDAFRVDTRHMLMLPVRALGFLSIVPRAGYRGTYYSKTREAHAVTNVAPVTNSLGAVVGVTNKTTRYYTDGDPVWRNLPEVGAEASFKAFGELYRGPVGLQDGDRDLRHVFEPYADYTRRFEPNALPRELWQFDDIDKLNETNTVRIGLRNYLQTRRKEATFDLVYVDTWADFNLDPEDGEDTFNAFGFETELRPWSWLAWDFSGRYDNAKGEFEQYKTRVNIAAYDVFKLGVDYRYQLDKREQVAADMEVFPEGHWSARVYVREDIKESHLDEHSYYVIHRTDCLGFGLGLRVRPDGDGPGEDDYTVWLRIWPLAFGNEVNMP